jgi:uncharacterized delta-60 repeat protein
MALTGHRNQLQQEGYMRNFKFASRRRSAGSFVAERLENRTLLSAGDQDPSFAGSVVITPLGAYQQVAGQAVAAIANGKILVAAEDGPNVALLQYLPNGKLDSSFGSGGEKIIGFGAGHVGQNLSLSIQSDGKILLAGDDQTTATHANEAFVLRLTTAGALDSTFGSGGESFFHLGSDDGAYVVAALPTGQAP